MRLFEITKLSYNESSKGYKIHLSELNGDICFSILIGTNEAHSIALALEGIQPPRPMTHDIILDILNSNGKGLIAYKRLRCIKTLLIENCVF